MRDDIRMHGWSIDCESQTWNEDFHESIFFVGNGRIGIRGYLPYETEYRPAKTGMFLAGIFGEIKSGITDMVNLPTPVCEKITIDGVLAAIKPNTTVTRTLDLQTGVFSAEYALSTATKTIMVRHERFIALHNTGCVLQRTILLPAQNMRIEIASGINLTNCNCPIPDDQVKGNDENIKLYREYSANFMDNGASICLETSVTGLTIIPKIDFFVDDSINKEELYVEQQFLGYNYTLDAKAGKEYQVDKLAFITTSRDKDTAINFPGLKWEYDEILALHKSAMENRWKSAEFETGGDTNTQTAIRYAMLQLIMNGPASDDSVSIGAHGLSHGRYKGCYFWDTDFFLLPFYLQTHPQTARNLMKYRVDCLHAAKEHAKKTNSSGARYPWMASLDGSEQCESWDIGLSEVHVTADIVFALNKYITVSGDRDFYPEAAAVYIETARFWISRYSRDAEGNANLLFVKGPDEYCGITRNNLFTNWLVQLNLKLAGDAAAYLYNAMPEKYKELAISNCEIQEWEALRHDIVIPRDPQTGHLAQDETFHLLEPIDLPTIKVSDRASYHDISFDRLQRYKVIKQAEVVLLMTRVPEDFTAEEKKQAWLDYEPRCLHDSTLSFATHALFAAQNGYSEKASDYLNKSLFLDLKDFMGNTGKEGLHLACFGEVWQAMTICSVKQDMKAQEQLIPECQPE